MSRGRNKPIEVNGTSYESLCAFAEHLGITSSTLSERYAQFGSYEVVEEYYLSKLAAELESETYVVNGKRCKTRREVYDALGLKINYTTFADYVRINGMQTAIEHYREVGVGGFYSSIERYTVGDVTNVGIKEAASLAHTAASTLRKRAEETGKSIQELLDESYEDWLKDPPPYTVDGRQFKNVTAVARYLGVGQPVIKKRIDAGMTVAEAVLDIRKCQFESNLSKEYSKAAESLGITVQLYRSMLKGLKTPEAVKDYVNKYSRYFETWSKGSRWDAPARYECVIGEKTYYVPQEVADRLGVSFSYLLEIIRANPGVPMQQLVDDYLSRDTNYVWTQEHKVNSEISRSIRNDLCDIQAVNKTLVFARCMECKRLLLLESVTAKEYRHSDSQCRALEWQ